MILQEGGRSIFLAGDTSYSQDLLLAGSIDGVAFNERAARQTIRRIQQYLHEAPTVYLPSHDPEGARRLSERAVAVGTIPVA